MIKKHLKIILIVLPILLEVLLSIVSEQNYFRFFTFAYPFYFAILFIYFMIADRLKGYSIVLLGGSLISHFAYGFVFYGYQQEKFTKYAQGNNLPLDLDGFAPYMFGTMVNLVLLIGLAIVIAFVTMIIYMLKRKQLN